MLLLAGLGIGAFMLFSGKSGTQSAAAGESADPLPGGEIPTAPNILAVNSSDTESPIPTGIVSDEDGMRVRSQENATPGSSASYDAEDEDDSPSPPVTKTVVTRQTTTVTKRKSQGPDVPALISTKLTPKEKAIIDKGVLTNDLAIKRPDLYKAIYVRKNKAAGSKALLAADAAIKAIQTKAKAPVKQAASGVQKRNRKVAIKLNPATAKSAKHLVKKTAAPVKAGKRATGGRVVAKPVAVKKAAVRPHPPVAKRAATKRPTKPLPKKHR